MKKLTLFTLLVTVLVAFGAPTTYAGTAKVSVCHIPPGNPENFHTITVNENTIAAHLAHGDVVGACDAACTILCDDGNACTIDDTGDCEQLGCPVTRQTVDCDDGNTCTADGCEPTQGCVNTAQTGEYCDDGETCTGVDTCDDQGQCTGPSIPNCCLDDNDCSADLCDNASCNTATNRCEDNPVRCDPPDLCHVSACDPTTGTCEYAPVICGPDEICDVGSGQCIPEVAECPCWSPEFIQSIGAAPRKVCTETSERVEVWAVAEGPGPSIALAHPPIGLSPGQCRGQSGDGSVIADVSLTTEQAAACIQQIHDVCK